MAKRLMFPIFLLATQLPFAFAAHAQPIDIPVPAATTTEFPAGVSVAKVKDGQVYVGFDGRTLYGMDMRMVARWSVDTSKYCAERCQEWEPLLAPAGAKVNLTMFRGFRGPPGAAGAPRPGATPTTGAVPGAALGAGGIARPAEAGPSPAQLAAFYGMGGAPAGMYTQQNAPDWTVVDGPAGPQYVYKGYNLVYVRKGDKPHAAAFDGADGQIWNTLKFIPPVPKLTAPGGVGATFVKDVYVLTDKDGKLLYTGRCGKDCVSWTPLAAGVASLGVGEWTVDRSTDRPQWRYRGKPVFVASDDRLAGLPRSTVALRP
jgi:predicted lipoprotein with Yx(FWY)xxD motif